MINQSNHLSRAFLHLPKSRLANRSAFHAGRAEHGVVLIIALVVLLAMTLAGALMLRNVGVGLGIAGNVAFKQEATSQADRGIEAAILWAAPPRTGVELETSNSGAAYSATWDPNFNPTTYDWSASVSVPADPGYTVNYVIHRLCKIEGPVTAAAQQCSYPLSDAPSNPGGSGTGIPSGGKQPFYRVTSRVLGPRNTVSYVQVVFY